MYVENNFVGLYRNNYVRRSHITQA